MAGRDVLALTALCDVNWAAFGLEPPEETPWRCQLTGVWLVRQGCVHEHVNEARPCSLHLAIMRSYGPFSEWGCARCLPEHASAPLIVTPLAAPLAPSPCTRLFWCYIPDDGVREVCGQGA